MYLNFGLLMVLSLVPIAVMVITSLFTVWVVLETLKVVNYFKETEIADDN
jgi:flagellar biosynthesis protein FliP